MARIVITKRPKKNVGVYCTRFEFTIFCIIDGLGDGWKHVMVRKMLPKRVTEVACNSIFGGHQGIKKLKIGFKTNLYWPGMQSDITSFCRSCDVCQRTMA